MRCEPQTSPAVLVYLVYDRRTIALFVPVQWQGDSADGRTRVFTGNVSPGIEMKPGEFMTLTLQFLGKGRCNGELSVIGRELVAPAVGERQPGSPPGLRSGLAELREEPLQ